MDAVSKASTQSPLCISAVYSHAKMMDNGKNGLIQLAVGFEMLESLLLNLGSKPCHDYGSHLGQWRPASPRWLDLWAAWTIDGAYFVGSTTLQLGLSKVEAASGTIACKLIDAAHLGAVPMHMI
uniref:Uncharacterized protein n=1 Tax=Saccharum hybrid cultivar R570 TaxID=131158 RepID=A0A059Q341_9POAL|nr:hypothetical protein SHCRBa_011_I19_F_190 [Saccharum hybrid cultivar R570]